MFELKTSVFLPSFVSDSKKKILKDLGCKIYEFNKPYSFTVKKCIEYSKNSILLIDLGTTLSQEMEKKYLCMKYIMI